MSLDVWGNRRDGFQVNDVFRTGSRITVPRDASHRQIVRALIEEGALRRTALGKVEVEFPGAESWGEINDAKTGKPLYQLQQVEAEEGGGLR